MVLRCPRGADQKTRRAASRVESFPGQDPKPFAPLEEGHVTESRIHPTVFVGDGVTLGEGVTIGPGAVVLGPCTIGDRVWIGSGAAIGGPPEISSLPQNAAWTGELDHAGVIIGAGSVIREGAVIHQGSHRPTTVGEGCWILNRAYLAHDVVLGDRVTISAGVSIGGHCSIGDAVNIGMNASIHQRRAIGAGAMVGMGTPLTKDAPPFSKVYGSPSRFQGLNTVGMERFGLSTVAIDRITRAYAAGDLLLTEVEGDGGLLDGVLRFWREQDPQKVAGSTI